MKLYFDGSTTAKCSGYGWVAFRMNRELIAEGNERINRVTSNVAEYTGLIRGISCASKHLLAGEPLEILGDSQLVINQITGTYRVKARHLLGFRNLAISRIEELRKAGHPVILKWIRRETNSWADRLAGEMTK